MTRRIRRLLKTTAVCAVVLFVAVSCSSAGNPISYDDQKDLNPDGRSVVESNWLEGCNVSLGEDLADSAESICECSYREISNPETGIPFEDFVAADQRLRSDATGLQSAAENPNSTEAKIVAIVARCIELG